MLFKIKDILHKGDETNLENKFLCFEHDYNLLNKEINGFKYWQHIRFELFREIQLISGLINENQKSSSRSYKKMIQSVISKNHLLYNQSVDLLVMGHYRYIKNKNNKYESIYTTPILKEINYKYLLIEPFSEENIHRDLELESTYYYTDLQLMVNVFIKFRLYKFLSLSKLKQESKQLASTINKEFNILFNEDKLYQLMLKSYIRWIFGKKYFLKLLSKLNPKVILEVVGYTPYNLILNEVAKSQKIPTIELQHGLIGEKHIAYNFIKKENYETFPDIILTYSDYWKKNTRFPISDYNVISTGFPYLENIVNEFNCKREKENKMYNILFISQWSIGKQLSEFAVELYNYFEVNNINQYKIHYHLHPEEQLEGNSQYERLMQYKDKINIIEKKHQSLYESFSMCDIQVGVYSTGLYEGLAFGLDTFILNIEGSDMVKDLVNHNYATYIDTVEQLFLYLINGENRCSNDNDFWSKDSLNNIFSVIEKVMKKERVD